MRGDVIAIASKVVSTCEGRIVRLQDVKVTFPARRLARRYEIDERLTTVVVSESDRIFGGVKGFLLTLKRGILTANAGVDTKNAPLDTAILWPKNSDISAKRLRHCLDRQYHTSICVEVVDSRVTPLRLGTTGLAIGLSGFSPVRDERRTPDIYGRTIRVTQTNVADDLAASAHLLMGEAASKIAAVIIRNADLKTTKGDSHAAIIEMKRCLVSSSLKKGI
jgi:coenzyme F420-0:L-glutamate ligase